MYSNNQKISSFYPNSKKNPNSQWTKNIPQTNPIPNINPNPTNNSGSNSGSNLGSNSIINFSEKNISDSVQLALITVNLTWQRFKSMELYEMENYVKTLAYNNSFESKKYLLALNILSQELSQIKNQITNFLLTQSKTPSKDNNTYNTYNTFNSERSNKINMNEILCIQPDEFNLDINTYNKSSRFSQMTFDDNSHLTHLDTCEKFNNGSKYNNFKKTIPNRNPDMNFSGNPFDSVKITNSNKNFINVVSDNNSLSSFTSVISNNQNHSNLNNHDLHTNFYTWDNSSRITNNHMENMSQLSQTNHKNDLISNSIIRQTNPIAKSNIFNVGNKRLSNLNVGNSNNYVVTK
jgi:hypothetical protein